MRVLRSLALLTAVGLAPAALAAPPEAKAKDEDAAFAKRLAALTKAQGAPIVVKMKPSDDPTVLPAAASTGGGMVLVAGGRMDIYTPPLLSPQDIQTVVQQHMTDVRVCYKKQLGADPEWADRLILDLAIKKTGRVSEVAIAPRRVRRAEIGKCLMASVPNWKFPEFTGETDDGITQEVVTASFPFSFSVN